MSSDIQEREKSAAVDLIVMQSMRREEAARALRQARKQVDALQAELDAAREAEQAILAERDKWTAEIHAAADAYPQIYTTTRPTDEENTHA